MLNKQRREKPLMNKAIKDGERVVRERFGVDAGHLHRRSLLHPPLGLPVADDHAEPRSVAQRSGHAGRSTPASAAALCGEVAHAAVLCPSFYRASIINNPTGWDRFKAQVRDAVIGFLQRRIARRQFAAA